MNALEHPPLLEISNLEVRYGGIQALHGLSLQVPKGSIVTLIGANGAGKSTTLRTISGLVSPSAGSIRFDGKEIAGKPAHTIVAEGLAHVPEDRLVFPELSVKENLMMGAYLRRDRKEIAADLDWVGEFFPRLRERIAQLAGTLSGGEQQMLAIGRALMGEPKLLMLDEPSLGLAPQIVAKIFEIIQIINQKGVPILLVEQNAQQALRIAHRGYVIVTGKNQLTGTGAELLASDEVRQAYLGE